MELILIVPDYLELKLTEEQQKLLTIFGFKYELGEEAVKFHITEVPYAFDSLDQVVELLVIPFDGIFWGPKTEVQLF